MKSLVLIALLFVSGAAQADIVKTVSCINKHIQDGYYSANFKIQNAMTGLRAEVDLFIPEGEMFGKSHKGTCRRGDVLQKNKRIATLTCTVPTSSDTGFKVELFDNGRNYTDAEISTLQTRGGPAPQVVGHLPNCTVN